MYSSETGRYVQITCHEISVPPMKISYAACRPITRPTAITIFRCASLSSGSRQPILENRSEPDQQSSAISARTNHMVLFLSF